MARRGGGSLRRHGPRRTPLSRFTLFTEGKNTEPSYFQALQEALGPTVSIKIRPCGSSPLDIARDAVRYLEREELRSSPDHEVWAVFDGDDHKDFADAIQLCLKNGVLVAYSIPCFELWLILHEADQHRAEKSAVMQKRLNRLRPEYDHRGRKCPDCAALIVNVVQAEERAEALLRRHQTAGARFANPSTTVFELTRAIRAAAEASRPR